MIGRAVKRPLWVGEWNGDTVSWGGMTGILRGTNVSKDFCLSSSQLGLSGGVSTF